MARYPTTSRDRVGLSTGPSEMAEAEENFCKSISNLVSTVITEGAKVSGERGAALISSILRLVPTLPMSPVLTPTIDLLPERECGIILGDAPWSVSCEPKHRELPPQFTSNQGSWELNH